MKTININEATGSQLVAFAQTQLNIEGVSTSLSKAAIIAKIKAVGYDQDTIEVEDAPAKAAAVPLAGGNERKMVTIWVDSTDQPGGQEPVPVAVNGTAMLIPRDQDSIVPYEYFEALKNAVRQVYTALPDGGLSEPKNVPSYPVRLVSA